MNSMYKIKGSHHHWVSYRLIGSSYASCAAVYVHVNSSTQYWYEIITLRIIGIYLVF
jgi:hypothetical protein